MEMGGSGEYPFGYGLASKLVHSKVKANLGLDKCKFGFTGAAPIMVDTLEYFGQLGIQINEVRRFWPKFREIWRNPGIFSGMSTEL